MRARLLVFAVFGLLLVGAMSLLVVSDGAAQAEPPAPLPQRLVAPVPALPQPVDSPQADQAVEYRPLVLTLRPLEGPQMLSPVQISPHPYPRCAYYAFHYADEAG